MHVLVCDTVLDVGMLVCDVGGSVADNGGGG